MRTMRTIILLCITYVVRAAGRPDCQDGITVHGIYHDKIVLKDGLDRPYQLAVDHKTNKVFFSYSISAKDDSFQSGVIDIDTKEFSIITGIKDGFANAVDQVNHVVYLGGSDGIYEFDPTTTSAIKKGAYKMNIWSLFFKDVLYYTTFPKQKLYSFLGQESSLVPEFADTKMDQFTVDKDNVHYFSNETGLYCTMKGTDNFALLDNTLIIKELTTDVNESVYFCGANGIYTINKKKSKVEKIAIVKDIFGLAFDKDNNMIVANSHQVFKLIPSKKNCNIV